MEAGFTSVAERDPDLRAILDRLGEPPSRARPAGLATLLRAIIGQQVSTASAAAIWQRFSDAFAPFEAGVLARETDENLRAQGLSGPKVRYVRALAEAVDQGHLNLSEMDGLDDETAIKSLIAVKGIGQWTAEVYLLTALSRPDIWPAGDLALVLAVQDVKGLDEKPDYKLMRTLAEPWRPFRSYAARLLWHHYGVKRQRQGQPLDDPGS